MTDYEAASLALQEVIALTAVAGIVVGFAQCALIWAGLRIMRRAADLRDVVTDRQHQADERRHAEAMKESDRRHAEAMKESDHRHAEAMKESDRRHAEAMKARAAAMEESERRHAEVMAAHDETMAAHAETMQALDGQRRALEVLIERTAPNPGAGE